jgi:hypothetical protein
MTLLPLDRCDRQHDALGGRFAASRSLTFARTTTTFARTTTQLDGVLDRVQIRVTTSGILGHVR